MHIDKAFDSYYHRPYRMTADLYSHQQRLLLFNFMLKKGGDIFLVCIYFHLLTKKIELLIILLSILLP